ncbi:hypothetical protein [Chitinimonas naiadis]
MPTHQYEGFHPELLAEFLCQRLAFEHTCIELHDAFVAKYLFCVPLSLAMLATTPATWAVERGVMPLCILRELRGGKQAFLDLISETLSTLEIAPGSPLHHADDAIATAADALALVRDDRTELTSSLSVLVVAESMESVSLQLLVDLLKQLREYRLAHRFQGAIYMKQVHLTLMIRWLDIMSMSASVGR